MKKYALLFFVCLISFVSGYSQSCVPNPASRTFGSGNTSFTIHYPGTSGNSCHNCYTYLKANGFTSGYFTINGVQQSTTNYLCTYLNPCWWYYIQYTNSSGQSSSANIYTPGPTVQNISMQIVNQTCQNNCNPAICSCNCSSVQVRLSSQACPSLTSWNWKLKVYQTSGSTTTLTTQTSTAQNPLFTIAPWNAGTEVVGCLTLCDGRECCQTLKIDCLWGGDETAIVLSEPDEFLGYEEDKTFANPLQIEQMGHDHSLLSLVYPNPANDHIYFQGELLELSAAIPTIVEIYNTLGQRIIYRQLNESELSVQTADLPNGVYYLSLRQGEKNLYSQKIIIRH